MVERISRPAIFDAAADQLESVAHRLGLDRAATATQRWLGHPVHPALTDLPIGFWTSAWVLDTFGGRRRSAAAQTLLGLGIVTALPTAATGLGDLHHLKGPSRRVAAVHAASNTVALLLAGTSWAVGRRRHRGLAIGLNWLAAAAATVGGHLGGELAFNPTDGDDSATEPKSSAPPTDEQAVEPGFSDAPDPVSGPLAAGAR